VSEEDAFLQSILNAPNDTFLRLVFADWLEEHGDPRGELLRLLHALTQAIEVPERDQLEDRLRSLLGSGVQPVGPYIMNSIEMKFALIPPGTFLMGSPEDEEGHRFDETQREATLSKGFYLAIHPVTQASWKEVTGDNPGIFKGDDSPVDAVSWEDCHEFLQKLSEQEGRPYRFPTEAEWEYACRAGTTTPFFSARTSLQSKFALAHTFEKGRPQLFFRMRGDYLTCMATCGSGVPTTTRNIPRVLRARIPRYCVVVLLPMKTSFDQPSVAALRRRTEVLPTVSVRLCLSPPNKLMRKQVFTVISRDLTPASSSIKE
jgi:uncharacterized protein (TIGR02996 family)